MNDEYRLKTCIDYCSGMTMQFYTQNSGECTMPLYIPAAGANGSIVLMSKKKTTNKEVTLRSIHQAIFTNNKMKQFKRELALAMICPKHSWGSGSNPSNFLSLPSPPLIIHTYVCFNGLFSRRTWVSRHQKGKPEMMGGSGIRWTICKSFVPHSRQITTPVPHHSFFTGQMLFMTPNQQCESTEGRPSRSPALIISPLIPFHLFLAASV